MQSATTDSTKLYELLAWFELNRKRVVIWIGLGLLLCVVVYVYLYYRGQTEQAASRALLALRPPARGAAESGFSPADLLKVANDYGSTSAGERALLLAAGQLFADGNYAEAQRHFERFQKEHSGSPLASTAAFGTAASLDALDQIDAALAAYQSVVNQFPDDAVATRAQLAMGMLHEAKDQPDQAHRIYDQLSKRIGVGAMVREAEARLEKLENRYPQLRPTNAPLPSAVSPAVPPPATTPASNSVSAPLTPPAVQDAASAPTQ